MTHDFPSIEEIISIHDVLIEQTGGAMGIRDMGALASAIMRPQIGYYDGLVDEAAALLESLTMNHPFVDGNKRTALGAVDTFLGMNGSFIDCDSQEALRPLHAAVRDGLVPLRGAARMAGGARQAAAWGMRRG